MSSTTLIVLIVTGVVILLVIIYVAIDWYRIKLEGRKVEHDRVSKRDQLTENLL